MAAGMPTLKVEIAFTVDTLDTGPIWSDVTSFVRAGSIRMGRTNELEEYQTGSCSLTLNNRARTFDPFYTAGPYYGNLKARKQCRITATYASITYNLFYGFVSGWKLAPNITGDSVCQIEGYDGLSYLAGVDLPPDYFTYLSTIEAATNQGVAWWPLGSDNSQCADKLGLNNFTFTTAAPLVGTVPSKWMQGNGTTFDGTYGAIGSLVPPNADGSWTVQGFFKTTVAGPVGFINPILCNAGPDNASIGIDSTGRLVWRNSSAGATNSGYAFNDGNWHHFAIENPASFVLPANIYVDGNYLSLDATGSGDCGTGFNMLGLSNHAGDLPAFKGELAHIQMFQYQLANEPTYAAAGLLGTVVSAVYGDQMLADVIDSTAWPVSWQTIDASTVKYGGVKWGTSALTMLQGLALTEGGRIFVNQAGDLTFYNRSQDLTAARSITSQATYSDSGSAGVIPFYAVGEIAYSDKHLANKVTVTTANGVAFTSEDTASQTTYGVVAQEIATSLASPSDAQTYADIYLTKYKTPSLRIANWQVLPQAKPAVAFPAVLDSRLTDRITFQIKPNNVGTRISEEMLIEQIVHEFTPDTWQTTFSGSPAVKAWVLAATNIDIYAPYSVLASTTILG